VFPSSRSLCFDVIHFGLEFLWFPALALAFQLFTRKHYLQISGLRMRNFTWNLFPIKHLPIGSLFTPLCYSTCLNIDTCKFEPSQKDEGRVQSADFSKACRKPELLIVKVRQLKYAKHTAKVYTSCFSLLAYNAHMPTHVTRRRQEVTHKGKWYIASVHNRLFAQLVRWVVFHWIVNAQAFDYKPFFNISLFLVWNSWW